MIYATEFSIYYIQISPQALDRHLFREDVLIESFVKWSCWKYVQTFKIHFPAFPNSFMCIDAN